MSKRLPRKIPAQPEKRRTHKAKERLVPSTVSWLPPPEHYADFEAWGKAAEKAKQYRTATLHALQRSPKNEALRREYDNIWELYWYCLDRAYPASFWEGMEELLAGKTANLGVYIAFLEADSYFFRSGYAKAEVIRGLKRQDLTLAQKKRLQEVVIKVVEKGFRREFRSYCRLARHIQTPEWLLTLEALLSSQDPMQALRAKWVLEACLKK